MMYLDLDELEPVLATSRWWQKDRLAIAQFKRSDYFGDANVPLKKAVLQAVNEAGIPLVNKTSRVCVLTNLRYFGYIINPITVYYCFDESGQLQAMLIEVTNTPWGQKHHYILKCDPNRNKQRITFKKDMHVSPFHPMDMYYNWISNSPAEKLTIHMQNCQLNNKENTCVFDATLILEQEKIEEGTLTKLMLSYPFMTLKVVMAIYWQAVKLFVKRVPFYSNPVNK